MGSTWRSISNGIFYFSLVASFIGVLIWAIMFFSDKNIWWAGFIVLVLGSVGVMVVHSLWGMLLEFFDNAAAQAYHTKEISDILKKQYGSASAPSFVHGGQPSANNTNYGTGFWHCKACGTSNSTRDTFCKNCGAYK